MILPRIDVPTYTVTLPSNGQKVRIRPFLVKEEKLLLMAAQSRDTTEIINTTKQVIKNCVLDDINVDKLPFFDVDYLIVALRAKSIGEAVTVTFTCNNPNEQGEKCGTLFDLPIDISKATFDKDPDIKDDIRLSEDIGVKMKYPTYSTMKNITASENPFDTKLRMIYGSMDYIYDKSQVYSTKDSTPEEVYAFLEGLTKTQLEKLEEYVNNFPKFLVVQKHKCAKCGFDHTVRYNNFDSFFL